MTPKPANAETATDPDIKSPAHKASPGPRGRVARHSARPVYSPATEDLIPPRLRIAPPLRPLAVPLSSVELHPRNPRVGDVEAVAASLRRFGQQKPIVVQKSTGWIIGGNHLVRAARSLGWTEIAANVVELDDATATAYMLAVLDGPGSVEHSAYFGQADLMTQLADWLEAGV